MGEPDRRLTICVFCASAGGLPEVYVAAARSLGEELARRGHRLVYGGGEVGLMGELARAVHRAGGEVCGVIPRALVEREMAYGPADELIITETLRERKAEMDRRADAFIALPGGFGTIEELVEVITLRQLGLHDRPVVLLNVDGYYDPFLAMVRKAVALGFARHGNPVLFQVADSVRGAVDLAEAGTRPHVRPSTRTLAENWSAPPDEPPTSDGHAATVER